MNLFSRKNENWIIEFTCYDRHSLYKIYIIAVTTVNPYGTKKRSIKRESPFLH